MPIMTLAMLLIFSNLTQTSSAIDSITQSQPLPDDGTTLVSDDGTFELGFFSPGGSSAAKRYVGIWYKNITLKTVVWVANRNLPINKDDSTSTLSITKEGNNLVLLSKSHTVLWSTKTKAENENLNPIVKLLDTGNLVLRDQNKEQLILWQSFDYPCDKLLPGMKLGRDLKTGLNRRLTAWRNWDDPSPGDFSWGIVVSSNSESIMWKGLTEYYRSGPWNGIGLNGSPALRANRVFDYKFVNNSNEVYYSYTLKDKNVVSILVMNQSLYQRQRIIWIPENNTWSLYQAIPKDSCDNYNRCGPYGDCAVNESPVCQCIDGFGPRSWQKWDLMDWTEGCVRNDSWSCKVKKKDGFRRFGNMKLPETTHSWVDSSMTLKDCKAKCWEDCSCTAYANLDVRGGGTGCAIWFGDLIDLREFSGDGGQDLYIRMAVSDSKKKVALIIGIIALVLVLVMLFACSYVYKTRRKYREKLEKVLLEDQKDEGSQEDFELPLFDLAAIVNATDGFSIDNKLGEGGFGPVYKGTLADGREIAVKRLSKSSRQGSKEFKNEVILCAKLQHRNLVKVIGCCIEGEEKMLLYEFMPNRSLDSFLFDSIQSKHLDWYKRLNIINGIARGLLYLHQDSRLRIIHRDLKASNVLLDNEMNPKISDFGLARMCGSNQIEGNTNKIVGTRGYMAPEYAIDGLFSIKSDVFSFGILLLEIISGMKSKGRRSFPSNRDNLIGHVWRLWKEGNPTNLIDEDLKNSCIVSEAFRCVHIGLLCVQQHPDDRPHMASVVVMLSSEIALSEPKEPAFLLEIVTMRAGSPNDFMASSSTNEVTMSIVNAR